MAVEYPVTVPIKALEITAILAGPPLNLPVKDVARSMKNLEAPVASKKAMRMKNKNIYLVITPMAKPKMPYSCI